MICPRQSIETKYLRPTEHRGSRIVAKCAAGRKVIPWDFDLGRTENHAMAACALAKALGWDMPTHLASTQKGYVAVYSDGLSYINLP
tara:strand:- start:21 stop:281 length:261 start_codon:yes stop_codon:yes gene_type:complete